MKMLSQTRGYHLPTSGQVIGELFEIFGVRYDPLLAKEFQRYFRGEKIEEDNRQRIFELLADAIIKILPHPEVFDQAFICQWGLKIQVIRAISGYVEKWESVRVKVSHWWIPIVLKKPLLVTLFRLATIDLALRLAAFQYISKSPHLKPEVPLWMKPEGNELLLIKLLDKCKGLNCKPIDIAFDAGALNEKTAKQWFEKGKRPSPKNIDGLAEAFAKRIPGVKPEELSQELQRHYLLHDLCSQIASGIGRDELIQLCATLFHYSDRLQKFYEREVLGPEQNYSIYLSHCFAGAVRSFNSQDFKHLWELETDPEWRRDLIMVGRDWFPRIVQRNLRIRGETVVSRSKKWDYLAGISDKLSVDVEYISAIFFKYEVNGDMQLWGGAGNEAYDWDKRTEAELREILNSNPNSSRAHLDLGVFLAHGGSSISADEGYEECLKAAELLPRWYRPCMEIAHILLRYKRFKEALDYLEQATKELPNIPEKLNYSLGFARMMNGDFAGALNILEKIIEAKPDHALALDNAAYCFFQIGNTIQGKSRAKRAHMYGISTTYDEFDVGGLKKNPSSLLQTLCERVGCREANCPGRVEVEEARENLKQMSKRVIK